MLFVVLGLLAQCLLRLLSLLVCAQWRNYGRQTDAMLRRNAKGAPNSKLRLWPLSSSHLIQSMFRSALSNTRKLCYLFVKAAAGAGVGQAPVIPTSSDTRPLPGRVLRPMIVAKQLDLPEGPSGTDVPTALPMPRTQLTRELEKYSRPTGSATTTGGAPPAAETPQVGQPCECVELVNTGWSEKKDTQFYFWDNFGNSAPILTTLSLLQAEIYGA